MDKNYLQKQYQITVQGRLKEKWAPWFNGMVCRMTYGEDTILHVQVLDQAALRGLLNKLWDLNLTLIAVILQDQEVCKGGPDENSLHTPT
jgi:hypothetical protein